MANGSNGMSRRPLPVSELAKNINFYFKTLEIFEKKFQNFFWDFRNFLIILRFSKFSGIFLRFSKFSGIFLRFSKFSENIEIFEIFWKYWDVRNFQKFFWNCFWFRNFRKIFWIGWNFLKLVEIFQIFWNWLRFSKVSEIVWDYPNFLKILRFYEKLKFSWDFMKIFFSWNSWNFFFLRTIIFLPFYNLEHFLEYLFTLSCPAKAASPWSKMGITSDPSSSFL